MTITILFDVLSTAAQYDQVIRDLEANGLKHPAGRLYHASQPKGDKWLVVDVWESQATFEKFGQSLLPILEKNGVKFAGPPTILPTHNIVKPN
jgi:hypothetical protein